jgi:RNA polymerase sigma factor (sigma-70 family)
MSSSPSEFHASDPAALLAHVDWVRELAASLVAEPADADDVAQRAWLEALERPPPRASRLRHWLALVTRNAARKLGRARRTRELHESKAPVPGVAPSTAELVERAELQRRVVGELLALAEPQRGTLLRRFFEGLDAAEIARRDGLPEETVRTRIKRGLAQLRQRLADGDPGRRELSRALAPLLLPTLTLAKGVAVSVTMKVAIAACCVAAASVAVFEFERRRPEAPPARTSAGDLEPKPAAAKVAPVAVERAPEAAAAAGGPPTAAPLAADVASGIVVDEQGRAIAGARVFAGRQTDEWFNSKLGFLYNLDDLQAAAAASEESQRFHGVTGPDGRFCFEHLSVPNVFTFAALDPAIGLAWRYGVQLPGEPMIRLVLQSGTVITGRVTAPDGRIEPNVEVEIGAFDKEFGSQFNDEWIEPGQGVVVCRTRTDARGEYRSLPLRYAHIEVGVELAPHVGDETVISTRSPVVRVEPTEREHRVDVVLSPRRKLRGRILVMNGEPARLKETLLPKLSERERAKQELDTFQVQARPTDPRVDLHLIEDPRPRSRGIHCMWGRVDVDHDSYEIEPDTTEQRWLVLIVRTGIVGFAEIVDPERGPDLRVDLAKIPAAKPWGRLHVHVFSGVDGQEIEKAEVNASYLVDNGISTWQQFAYETTSGNGRAVVELTAGPSVVHVNAKGFVAVARSVVVRPDAETDADFELVPAAVRLRGTVVDEAGRPASGVSITIYRRADESWEAISTPSVRSDAAGRFEIGSLPEEPLEVVAFDWSRTPAHVASDEGVGDRAVKLTMARGVEVTLVTCTAAGGAVPQAMYRICGKDGVPLVDSHAPFMNSGLFGGDGAKFWLPAEELDFTAWSPNAPPVTLRATPQQGGTITFTLKNY